MSKTPTYGQTPFLLPPITLSRLSWHPSSGPSSHDDYLGHSKNHDWLIDWLWVPAITEPTLVRRKSIALTTGNGLAPNKPGFSFRWYPYEWLVATGRASGHVSEFCSVLSGTWQRLNELSQSPPHAHKFFPMFTHSSSVFSHLYSIP